MAEVHDMKVSRVIIYTRGNGKLGKLVFCQTGGLLSAWICVGRACFWTTNTEKLCIRSAMATDWANQIPSPVPNSYRQNHRLIVYPRSEPHYHQLQLANRDSITSGKAANPSSLNDHKYRFARILYSLRVFLCFYMWENGSAGLKPEYLRYRNEHETLPVRLIPHSRVIASVCVSTFPGVLFMGISRPGFLSVVIYCLFSAQAPPEGACRWEQPLGHNVLKWPLILFSLQHALSRLICFTCRKSDVCWNAAGYRRAVIRSDRRAQLNNRQGHICSLRYQWGQTVTFGISQLCGTELISKNYVRTGGNGEKALECVLKRIQRPVMLWWRMAECFAS